MASQTQVDVSGMTAAAGSFNEKSSEMQNQEQQVQSAIQSLMATWKGQSAMSFNGAMEQFYEECNTVIKTLQQLAEAVNTSANNYQAQHEQNTQLATNFASQVPAGLSGF